MQEAFRGGNKSGTERMDAMRIVVKKCDGSTEPYLHTKVLGTLNHALTIAENDNLYAAEQFAEAVTFYVYGAKGQQTLTSDEIHQMIISMLSGTGYEYAAEIIAEHRLSRRLSRRRIEVISDGSNGQLDFEPWDKGKVARDLIDEHCIDALIARTIAGAVEEKVLAMRVSKVRKPLIKQLVVTDMEAILEADCRLAAAAS